MKKVALGLTLWLVIFLVLGELYANGHTDWGIAGLAVWIAVIIARKLFGKSE
ncbi:MAG: hypothetical protein WCA26_00310 [Xanthobacteraceae bacterium]|jgi:hypothetical protein